MSVVPATSVVSVVPATSVVCHLGRVATSVALAIVREIAELYGGSVELSAAPLRGLRAVLRLPAGLPGTRKSTASRRG